MLSAETATPMRARIARRMESSAATAAWRPTSESMRSTESCAASSARSTRALSSPHAAIDIIVPSSGQARATPGRPSPRHATRHRHSTRLILKMDS
jgi:hypothetical protein